MYSANPLWISKPLILIHETNPMQQCLPTRTVPCKLIVKDWNVLPEPECEFELGMEQEMDKGLWR